MVRDFGPGMDESQLQHAAEAFYRADAARLRSTGGVGLGLYLCKLVAEAHGGTLALRNAHPGLEITADAATAARAGLSAGASPCLIRRKGGRHGPQGDLR